MNFNIHKMAERNWNHIPKMYGVSGNEPQFSASIESLNNHPSASMMIRATKNDVITNKEWYRLYVSGNYCGLWSERTNINKEYDHCLCQVCFHRSGTTLHHYHYDTVGCENVAGDVVLVCVWCHFKIHKPELQNKYASADPVCTAERKHKLDNFEKQFEEFLAKTSDHNNTIWRQIENQ